MTFSYAFSLMKKFDFPLIFHWKYTSIGSDNGLVPNRQQAIIGTKCGLVYWCVYASSASALVLTHWGWDKMAVIFQTTFSNAFSWMKMNEFWLNFHWSLFPRVQLTIFQHWFPMLAPRTLLSGMLSVSHSMRLAAPVLNWIGCELDHH